MDVCAQTNKKRKNYVSVKVIIKFNKALIKSKLWAKKNTKILVLLLTISKEMLLYVCKCQIPLKPSHFVNALNF